MKSELSTYTNRIFPVTKDSSPDQGKVAVDGEWPGFAVF
jgi:hypothetical protein